MRKVIKVEFTHEEAITALVAMRSDLDRSKEYLAQIADPDYAPTAEMARSSIRRLESAMMALERALKI